MNKMYSKLPAFLQDLAITSYGFFNDRLRYGKKFDRALLAYNRNDELASDKLLDLQVDRLSKFLVHASTSKFWEARFNEFDVDPSGDPIKELAKLPVLTKHEVVNNAELIKINTTGMLSRSTSGSTGTGLKFWGDRRSDAEQWAVWWRYWSRFGFSRETWCGHFGGKAVVSVNVKDSRPYRVNYSSKQIMFSAYHVSEERVSCYIDAINKYGLTWLHGYASVISEVARLSLKKGLKINHKLRGISLGSENVTPTHERVIFEFFGIKPIQHYGLAEGVANFSNMPDERGLFVDEDFSFVEFLPVGSQFKIIGTNFTNYAFPLIRYDTSDLASDVDNTVFPRVVWSVDGRQDDYICLPTGERVGRVASVFNEFDFIDESQLFQKSLSALIVRVVKNSRWNSESEGLVHEALRKKLGSEIDIVFDYVEAVQRTASGKVRFVISEV